MSNNKFPIIEKLGLTVHEIAQYGRPTLLVIDASHLESLFTKQILLLNDKALEKRVTEDEIREALKFKDYVMTGTYRDIFCRLLSYGYVAKNEVK